jgi:uncharacterized protein (TIGR02145 family)
MRNLLTFAVIAAILLALAGCKADKNLDVIKDIDGNIYGVITIGKQKWLQQNLKVTHYSNGDSIINITDSTTWASNVSPNPAVPAYCNYNNVDTNARQFGRLYNWYAVNDPRQICPAGWHVPGDTEWHTLALALDPNALWAFNDAESNTAGGMLKSITLWNTPNTGATNSQGFTGLPAGVREKDGQFFRIDLIADFWSSTATDTLQNAWLRALFWEDAQLHRFTDAEAAGYSVRCIKN